MELGITWFEYRPFWKNNRELPEDEQLSLQIKRLKPIDTLYEDNEKDLNKWRDDNLKKYLDDSDYSQQVKQMPVEVLKLIKRFSSHTKDFKNFLFDGKEKTEPIDVFLNPGYHQKWLDNYHQILNFYLIYQIIWHQQNPIQDHY